jgi:hypothetical protein
MNIRQPKKPFPTIGNRIGYLLAVTSFLYILLSLVIYALPSLQAWQNLAFAPIGPLAMVTPPFADLAMLTHSARCAGSPDDFFGGVVNCDPYGRLFTYPPMALWMFSALGLSVGSLGWLGLILGLAAALLIAGLFFALIPSALVAGLLLALAYLSLPFQLALERGNNDLIVFLLLAALAHAIAAEKGRSAAAGLAFLAVATKILPLFGIIASHRLQPWSGSGTGPPARNLRWALLGAVAGLGVVLPWIGPILRNAPRPDGGLFSHGLIAGVSFSGDPSARLEALGWLAMRLTFLVAGVAGAWQQGMPQHLRSFLLRGVARVDSRVVAVALSLFTATWIGTYLFTRSLDYKSIFLLPALGISGALLCQENRDGGRRGWISLVLLPMLCIWFFPYLTITFFLPIGELLGLASDNVLLPLLAGALTTGLLGCRPLEVHRPPAIAAAR